MTPPSVWYADLPTTKLPASATIDFVLDCEEKEGGERHRVAISEPE